jgi:hypothetical protein
MNIATLKKEAQILADEEGINVEYNRALCELIAGVDGKSDGNHEQKAKRMGIELGIEF